MPRTAKKKGRPPKNQASMIALPADLIHQVEEKLRPRGIHIEDYLAIHLRQMLKVKVLYDLGDPMPFGKFAGEEIEMVCRASPDYMAWMINTHAREERASPFTPRVLQLVQELTARADAIEGYAKERERIQGRGAKKADRLNDEIPF